jgi:ribosomal-protein-alanine N-acetyltransferase
MVALETARLCLRRLQDSDLDVYYQRIYADPEVMKTLPVGAPISRQAFNKRIPIFMTDHWTQHGFGPWVMIHKAHQAFIGHCGLKFWPESTEVEVFCALDKRYWGQGLATEGARASLRYGFEALKLNCTMAATLPENQASRRVLEKIGLVFEGEMSFGDLMAVRYTIDRSMYVVDESFEYRVHDCGNRSESQKLAQEERL